MRLRTPREFDFERQWDLNTELPQTGKTDFWRAQTKHCAHQDPGQRSSDPIRYWTRLACECSGVSGGGVGQQWPAAVSGELNTTVPAQVLLKEVTITIITPTVVWLQVKQKGGKHSPPHQQKNWIKDLLIMAPLIRIRSSFPHSKSLSSGSFHKCLILIHQRADRMKTTITEKKPNWSHGPQPSLTQRNYEPCHVRPPKTDRS